MIHPGQTWAPWAWAGEFRGLIDSYNSLLPHFNPFFYAPRPIHLFCRRRAADWESRNCWHQTIVVHFDTAAFVLSHRSSWPASTHGISMLTYMVIISKEVSSNQIIFLRQKQSLQRKRQFERWVAPVSLLQRQFARLTSNLCFFSDSSPIWFSTFLKFLLLAVLPFRVCCWLING